MVTIVRYSEEYKSDMIQLILNIWENEFDYKGLDRPDIHDIPTWYLHEGGNFWLAIDNDKLVGTAGIIKKQDGIAYLKRMAVAKEYRKKGIGRLLLETAIEFAKSSGISEIHAGLVPENTKAISFYKDNGFVESTEHHEGLVVSDHPVHLKLVL